MLPSVSKITPENLKPITIQIFPDSRASICLAGPHHLDQMGLKHHNLMPSQKEVKAVGGSKLLCCGWLPINFTIGMHITNQPVYFWDKVDHFYFSKKGCQETNILPPQFSYPMDTQNAPAAIATSTEPPSIEHKHLNSNLDPNFSDAPASATPQLPQRPTKLPFPATDGNIPKVEQYLLDQFCNTTFNCSAPFPIMLSLPAHIYLKDGVIPYARHMPIPVPLHWKEQVKASLDDDVKRGIIAPVPVGTPVTWCNQMIITAKKDGTPRPTVDL